MSIIMPAKKSTATVAPSRPYGLDPQMIFGLSQQALERWVHGVSAVTEEMTQFVQGRVQEDMGVWMRLAACRDPNEVLECQRHFMEKATHDYFQEAGKLSRLAMSIATEGFGSPQGGEPAAAREARAA